MSGSRLVQEFLALILTRRLIGGISSGGICAFNAAWHRPDRFGRVLSHCGSFTAIRGGHHYPYYYSHSSHHGGSGYHYYRR